MHILLALLLLVDIGNTIDSNCRTPVVVPTIGETTVPDGFANSQLTAMDSKLLCADFKSPSSGMTVSLIGGWFGSVGSVDLSLYSAEKKLVASTGRQHVALGKNEFVLKPYGENMLILKPQIILRGNATSYLCAHFINSMKIPLGNGTHAKTDLASYSALPDVAMFMSTGIGQLPLWLQGDANICTVLHTKKKRAFSIVDEPETEPTLLIIFLVVLLLISAIAFGHYGAHRWRKYKMHDNVEQASKQSARQLRQKAGLPELVDREEFADHRLRSLVVQHMNVLPGDMGWVVLSSERKKEEEEDTEDVSPSIVKPDHRTNVWVSGDMPASPLAHELEVQEEVLPVDSTYDMAAPGTPRDLEPAHPASSSGHTPPCWAVEVATPISILAARPPKLLQLDDEIDLDLAKEDGLTRDPGLVQKCKRWMGIGVPAYKSPHRVPPPEQKVRDWQATGVPIEMWMMMQKQEDRWLGGRFKSRDRNMDGSRSRGRSLANMGDRSGDRPPHWDRQSRSSLPTDRTRDGHIGRRPNDRHVRERDRDWERHRVWERHESSPRLRGRSFERKLSAPRLNVWPIASYGLEEEAQYPYAPGA
mmetsp:Transcript_140150/g.244087  ORF Transcript_140150/g.244087 Transcript_140150/m.244087 type:complete len:588 (-) Transcript_140150:713-2476(-)